MAMSPMVRPWASTTSSTQMLPRMTRAARPWVSHVSQATHGRYCQNSVRTAMMPATTHQMVT